MKILNFGSMNVDYVYKVDHFVIKGETISSDELKIFGGGKGLNQSIALSRAGEKVYHAGAVGKDGGFLLDILNRDGVDTSYITIREEEPSGHAIIQNDRRGDNCIIVYGGANQSIGRSQVDQILSGFGAGDVILLQNEINELDYIIRQAGNKGMKIVLNPSPMDRKIITLPLDLVDYFLVNEAEAAALADEAGADEDAVLKSLVKKFPKARIVMTLGENGSVYWDGVRICRQPAVPADAVDTTAAGDTYTGYFISGILRGLRTEKVLYRASVAASITVGRAGAAPSIPDQKEVEEMITKIERGNYDER